MCLNTLNNGISSKKAKKKPDEAFQDCFFSILKVFLNLTHNFGKLYILRLGMIANLVKAKVWVTQTEAFR